MHSSILLAIELMLLVACALLLCCRPSAPAVDTVAAENEPSDKSSEAKTVGKFSASAVDAAAKVYAPDGFRDETIAHRTLPALEVDEAYDSPGVLPTRRMVYRVTLAVPARFSLGSKRPPSAAAELSIDLNEERLRARFATMGWPLPSTAEVRLRADRSGTYVFDHRGGRPLAAGQLASWFEGGVTSDRDTISVQVKQAAADARQGAGPLLCALLAEWSNQKRPALQRQCGHEGAPLAFRIGAWRAVRTAEVTMQAPRFALRADHLQPPHGLQTTSSEGETVHGLQIINRRPTRMLIVANGSVIGWLPPGKERTFSNLGAGVHWLGALRPLGPGGVPPAKVTAPGQWVLH